MVIDYLSPHLYGNYKIQTLKKTEVCAICLCHAIAKPTYLSRLVSRGFNGSVNIPDIRSQFDL